ncbi:MAG: hypothetical protein U0176_11515 [Bacteroidia bacterium]
MKAFAEIMWHDYPKMFFDRIRNEILSQGKDYILSVDDEEYIEYLVNKYELEPLEIDQAHPLVDSPQKSTERRRDGLFNRETEIDCLICTVTYQFSGTGELFKVQPNPHTSSTYDITVIDQTVSFQFKIYRQDPLEFRKVRDECYWQAFANLPFLNNWLYEITSGFQKDVRHIFSTEKKKLINENKFFAAINVKINPASNSLFEVPAIRKISIPKPNPSNGNEYSSEPGIGKEIYHDILKILFDLGKSMERKPSMYKNKAEEELRDHFLFVLETRYEGTTASGETFNKGGKTDIILKYANDGSNLFVAECKFWHGKSEFHKAISQLFDNYLTWRDSKAALLVFVQNRDFSNVLSTIKASTEEHPYYVDANGARGDSSFSFIFHLPNDKDKMVYLEIIAFHFV